MKNIEPRGKSTSTSVKTEPLETVLRKRGAKEASQERMQREEKK